MYMSLEYKEGREAYADGLDVEYNNAYERNSEKYENWRDGYRNAKYEDESED